MTPTETTDITLEQARAVVNAHKEAEYAARVEENSLLIGKCFKYRNSYGAGSDIGPWWAYFQVTGVSDLGVPLAWSFQQIPGGDVEIRKESTAYISEGNGYREVPAPEFWRAASKARDAVIARLTPSVTP